MTETTPLAPSTAEAAAATERLAALVIGALTAIVIGGGPSSSGLSAPPIGRAGLVVPLALTPTPRAWCGRFARPRRLARVTLPICLSVSVSGFLVSPPLSPPGH